MNKVSVSPGQISPTQLWPTLRPELQLRLIQLLARLASNLISTQVQVQITSSSKIETEEVCNAT